MKGVLVKSLALLAIGTAAVVSAASAHADSGRDAAVPRNDTTAADDDGGRAQERTGLNPPS